MVDMHPDAVLATGHPRSGEPTSTGGTCVQSVQYPIPSSVDDIRILGHALRWLP